MKIKYLLFSIFIFNFLSLKLSAQPRIVESFNKDWKFYKGDTAGAQLVKFNDYNWRKLDLPHDWSIEGLFNEKNPSTINEAALPTGVGWYRKSFILDPSFQFKQVFIDFDGVYCNSEIWINGHYLGKRPNGFISFQYSLNPYLKYGKEKNVIAVKVDNSLQPNSRWYTGSGIFRNVWLTVHQKIAVAHWGTYVKVQSVVNKEAVIQFHVLLTNPDRRKVALKLISIVKDRSGKIVAKTIVEKKSNDSSISFLQHFSVPDPQLWSVDYPNLYCIETFVYTGKLLSDIYKTPLGIRTLLFDRVKGFSLNGIHLKIKGVCMHQDFGALGTVVNARAIEHQLVILKQMGCNAIRTAHNPPAPEFLDLCDQMGFLVMDEAFDMWEKKKNKMDYHLDFMNWYHKDLEDQIVRDRNHPCVFMWSIGNEIREQFDSTGISIAADLTNIIKKLDSTRSVTSALTELDTSKNFIFQSHVLDVTGWNYNEKMYPEFLKKYPGQKFIASETVSGLASRGHYDMPSDSVRLWPASSKDKYVKNGNPDFTVSAYDNVSAYWGSTHEATWKIVKKYDFLSGMFVWSGFDYLGEPVPYPWPARSSYYGIIDLAGFPKDVYFMYQSEWSDQSVLHLFPHWNWKPGQLVDVWAYYNHADEIELYLNGKSLGIKKKGGDDLHVMWRVPFEPGILKAETRLNGNIVLSKQIETAGKAEKIELKADRNSINFDGKDLSYITVSIKDARGNLVPYADNLIQFSIEGNGRIVGVDNGLQTSMEPFKANYRKAYNGLCLVIIQAESFKNGNIKLSARSNGLSPATLKISSR